MGSAPKNDGARQTARSGKRAAQKAEKNGWKKMVGSTPCEAKMNSTIHYSQIIIKIDENVWQKNVEESKQKNGRRSQSKQNTSNTHTRARALLLLESKNTMQKAHT